MLLFAGGIFLVLRLQSKPYLYLSPLADNPDKLTTSVAGPKLQQISASLREHHINFDKVEIKSDTTFSVLLKNGGIVMLTSGKSIEQQVSSLQLILDRLTMEGKHFASLDFRYAKPVVVIR